MKIKSIKDNVVYTEFDKKESLGEFEIVEFNDKEKTQGLVMSATEKGAYFAILSEEHKLNAGMIIKSTGKILKVNIPLAPLGKVFDYRGEELKLFIEEKGIAKAIVEIVKPKVTKTTKSASTAKSSKAISATKATKTVVATIKEEQNHFFKFTKPKVNLDIEPEIINLDKRSLVNRTLRTGTLLVDATLAIGKGQRELIVGDRQTGKTAIALDAIINQKGQDVICVYNMIGGKTQDIIRIYEKLKLTGALEYTLIVASTSSDSSIKQWLSPYVATTFAEAFRDEGKDVLIVYDDLSSHAKSYRSFNLLMGAHPGREAYPGDIFYIHSRLLERSGQFNSKAGGGSITALPIVQTEKGNISAYVPTNIISITDGQIFTNSEMFNKNIRPAVDINLSVSRVGSNAQTKYMKMSVGSLKSLVAQYSKIKETFISESALSPEKRLIYRRGQVVNEMFIQKDSKPWRYEFEWLLILLMNAGHFDEFDLKDIQLVKKSLFEFSYKDTTAKKFLEYIEKESSKNYKKQIIDYFTMQIFVPFIKWLGSTLYAENEDKFATFKTKYAQFPTERYDIKLAMDSYELYSSHDEVESDFVDNAKATSVIRLDNRKGGN